MVYAEPYVYLRALGVFGSAASPLEQWSAGFKFRNPGAAPSTTNLVSFLESVSAPVSTFHAGAIAAGSNCFLTELTAAYIGTDGKYVGGGAQSTTHRLYGTPTPGGGTTQMPYSQSLVISLRTLLTRGRGSNGRVYWPATAMAVAGSTGLVAPAQIEPAADAAKVLLDALNTHADTNLPGTGGLSVMSKVGTGIAATVIGLRMGRRMDHQESRERSLSEAYTNRSVAGVSALVQERDNRPIGE